MGAGCPSYIILFLYPGEILELASVWRFQIVIVIILESLKISEVEDIIVLVTLLEFMSLSKEKILRILVIWPNFMTVKESKIVILRIYVEEENSDGKSERRF